MAITNIKKGAGGSDLEPRVVKNEEDILSIGEKVDNHEIRINTLENADIESIPVGTSILVGKDLDLAPKGYLRNDQDLILPKVSYEELALAFLPDVDIETGVVDYEFPENGSFQISKHGFVAYHDGYNNKNYFDSVKICTGWGDSTPITTIPMTEAAVSANMFMPGRVRYSNGKAHVYVIYERLDSAGSFAMKRISFDHEADNSTDFLASLEIVDTNFDHQGSIMNFLYLSITKNYIVFYNRVFKFDTNGDIDDSVYWESSHSTISEQVVLYNDYRCHKGYIYHLETGASHLIKSYDYSYLQSTYVIDGQVYWGGTTNDTAVCYKVFDDGTSELMYSIPATTAYINQPFFSINDKFFFIYSSQFGRVNSPSDNFIYNAETNEVKTAEEFITDYDWGTYNKLYAGFFHGLRNFDMYFNEKSFSLYHSTTGGSRKVITPVVDTELFTVKARPDEDDKVWWVYTGVIPQ